MRIAELRHMAAGNERDALSFMLFQWDVNPRPYEEWADAVEGAMSFIAGLLAVRRNDLQDLGEDALTAMITAGLECIGLDASSSRVGGNCDVTIRFRGQYLWLGEAKIFNGVAHVWGGYQQLVTRYRTELQSHSRGGLLLYCFKGAAGPLLASWRAALSVQVAGIATQDGSKQLSFCSQEPIADGECAYTVTHFAFPLFHDPQDGKTKLSPEAFEAAREAKKATPA